MKSTTMYAWFPLNWIFLVPECCGDLEIRKRLVPVKVTILKEHKRHAVVKFLYKGGRRIDIGSMVTFPHTNRFPRERWKIVEFWDMEDQTALRLVSQRTAEDCVVIVESIGAEWRS